MKYLVNFNIGHLIYSPYIIVHQYCGQQGLKCQERFNVSQKSITSRCPLQYPKFTFKNSMKYFGVKSAKLCSGRMAIDVIPTTWYIEFGKTKNCVMQSTKKLHIIFSCSYFSEEMQQLTSVLLPKNWPQQDGAHSANHSEGTSKNI